MTKEMFDGESARLMMDELRETYSSGITKSYEWRISQLKNIHKIAEFHEKEIVEALRSDLSKPMFESMVHEVYILTLLRFYAFMIMVVYDVCVCVVVVN